MSFNQLLHTFNSPLIIAEIGVNHEGSFEKACELVELAQKAGADCVKFQSYTPSRYASADDQSRLKRVSNFALSEEEFLKLSDLAKTLKIGFLSTPVTEDWVEILAPLCPAFKIASGDITFKPVIQKAAQSGKPLIISTGAATVDEIDQAVGWVREEVGQENLKEKLVLMHCVASYPTPVEQANLLSIPFLKDRYDLCVGYSNHVIGIDIPLAAVALGADVIEVHFTDQKEGREFRDHALSVDPQDLQKFVALARIVKKSLGDFKKCVQPCEKEIVQTIRKGIVAARPLQVGTILCAEDLLFARPATEFQACDLDKLVGQTLSRSLEKGFSIPRDAITKNRR